MLTNEDQLNTQTKQPAYPCGIIQAQTEENLRITVHHNLHNNNHNNQRY